MINLSANRARLSVVFEFLQVAPFCTSALESLRSRREPAGRPQGVTRPCPQSRGVVGLFVVRRHELTDESWAVIGPLLAPSRIG
ncbi:hypothetical protein ACWC9X_37950, partial [Streptomyces asoensis]